MFLLDNAVPEVAEFTYNNARRLSETVGPEQYERLHETANNYHRLHATADQLTLGFKQKFLSQGASEELANRLAEQVANLARRKNLGISNFPDAFASLLAQLGKQRSNTLLARCATWNTETLLAYIQDLPHIAAFFRNAPDATALRGRVRAWEVLDDVQGTNSAFRSKIDNLETVDGFFAKYPSRIGEFISVLNNADLHPSLLDKEAFLISVKIFDDTPSITNTSQLINVLTNVRSVHRVSDLEIKGLNKFFRGTNLDANGVPYPGNPNTIANGTSTSSDPIVATIFGIEARTEFGGSGKLLLYQPSNLGPMKLMPPNYRVELEREIIMDVTPTNIYGMKDFEIDVDDARSIIQQITGHNLDSRILSTESTQALRDAPRMTPEQINQFYQMASEL